MPIPNEDVVRATLAKHGRDGTIRACIENAWSSVKTGYVDRPRWRRKSTTRALMWEASIEAVTAGLEGDAGINAVAHHDTVSFVADDAVLFRLKKATISLFSTNYPTHLARLFHAHDTQDLFGHEGHHRVEIVHVFNKLQTALDWIGVVARDKRQVLWQFELPEAGTNIIALPTLPIDAPAATGVLRPAAQPAEINPAKSHSE